MKRVKEAVAFKERVNNVDALFVKRIVKSRDETDEENLDAEVQVLLKSRQWKTVKGYQTFINEVQHNNTVMFRKFDEDFYDFGDALNKQMKDGEKLWVSLGGYSGEDIDYANTDMYEMPTDDDYRRTGASYWNFTFTPYDSFAKDRPDTWKKVHDAVREWNRNTDSATLRQYYDARWIEAIGPRLEK